MRGREEEENKSKIRVTTPEFPAAPPVATSAIDVSQAVRLRQLWLLPHIPEP